MVDTTPSSSVSELKSDFQMLLTQNLEHLKNEILNTKWEFGLFDFGGESYQGKDAEKYVNMKYPRTALNILQNIENILDGKDDLVFGIIKIANEVDDASSSKRFEIYKDYKAILNNMSLFVLEMMKEQIQTLIKDVQSNKKLNPYVSSLESITKKLNESLKGGSSPITSLITLESEISKNQLLQEDKFLKFFKKKIFPFIGKLDEVDQNIKSSEATQDLNTVINAMIQFNTDPRNSSLVVCRLNAFKEIMVRVGSSEYNLTQILKHEPDFSKLKINDQMLDQYFNYLAYGPPKILPPPLSAGMATFDFTNQTPDKFKNQIAIMHRLKDKTNNFAECHSAHVLAMNIYTGPAYYVMNMLLRDKSLNPELFNGSISDELKYVQMSMTHINSLRDPVHLRAPEINKLIQETMLAIAVAAQGIEKSKHGEAEPHIPVSMIDDMLDPQQSRTVRGTGGDWAGPVKDRYRMAYEAGLPLYASEFASTSFSPDIAKKFTKDLSEKFITKHVPIDVTNQGGLGVDVTMISAFDKEAEYLYPPGCLILPTPESTVKRPEHYAPGLDKKLGLVMTKGSSEKSFAYSSEVQSYRNSLISLYEEIKNQKFPEPLDKKQNQLLSALENNINKLATNLKVVNFLVLNEIPKNMHDPLFANCDACFVLTKAGKLSFIDIANQSQSSVQLSAQDQRKLTELFKLNEEKMSNQEKISYEKMHLLEKMMGEKLALRHDSQAMLNNMAGGINKIQEDYKELKQLHEAHVLQGSTTKLYQQLHVTQHSTPAVQANEVKVKEKEKAVTNEAQSQPAKSKTNQTEKEPDRIDPTRFKF